MIKKSDIFITAFLVFIFLFSLKYHIQPVLADVQYCDDDELILCVDIYELFPESQITAMQNINGYISHFIDIDTHYMHFEYDATLIPFTFVEMNDYINLLELNLKMNRAHTTNYPDGQVMPICINDRITGSLSGVYVENGQLVVQQPDLRCGGCVDQCATGGLNEIDRKLNG